MKKFYFVLLFSSVLFMATKQVDPTEDNPFFKEYATPFEVPPFDKIDTTHYIPAFERGFAEQQAEIDAIINNADAPTFENTIMALENSGKLLRKVNLVFGAVSGANTTKALQNINRKISPLSTKHRDNINLNDKLFARIKTIYDNRLTSNLDAEQLRTVEKYYDDFIRSGANLNETDKQKLREMNQKMSALGVRFGDYQLEETNTNFVMVIDNIKDLEGLSKDDIEAAAITAKQMKMEGKWAFTLQKPSLLPFLQYAKNRELREKLYKGYYMRGNNNNKFDTKEIVAQIYNLRLERAKLMGYKTYAEFGISNNMAQTPENVYKFLNDIMTPTMEMAIKDRAEMQKI
ncbi:MAG TPA: peptidase M3, partial [Bacteroidales bacterium]|nr:peptidase M3 [Bacteroidales bacterium]